MPSVHCEHLVARGFRNIDVTIEPCTRFNVLSGDNGQGKTNLIEALYVVATSKSFRTSRVSDLISFRKSEGEQTTVRARFRDDGSAWDQAIGLDGGRRTLVEGKKPASMAAFAVRTPVVVFSPSEATLSTGAGSERRKMLDRLALYRDPASAIELASYRRAAMARQRVLATSGRHARELDAWETLMARHGMEVIRSRKREAADLFPRVTDAFCRIGAPGSVLELHYATHVPETIEQFQSELAQRRTRDAKRPSASLGPHRDDVAIALNGDPARRSASQGQHRAMVLALKAAEMDAVAAARGKRPILLLDDVSSELDESRSRALFDFLAEQEGQVFITTTRPLVIGLTHAERRDFDIVSGRISARQ